MALLDRVKKRIEADVDDSELQLLIDEALAAIADRFGPSADPTAPITETVDGGTRTIDLVRPVDTAQTVVVVEYLGSVPDAALDDWAGFVFEESATTLAAGDYRVRNGGRTLERVFTGPNSRSRWGTRVDITYTPANDGDQRQEVVIKLVALALEYQGVAERRVGDTQSVSGARSWAAGQAPLLYSNEREALLETLRPRGGVFLR